MYFVKIYCVKIYFLFRFTLCKDSFHEVGRRKSVIREDPLSQKILTKHPDAKPKFSSCGRIGEPTIVSLKAGIWVC